MAIAIWTAVYFACTYFTVPRWPNQYRHSPLTQRNWYELLLVRVPPPTKSKQPSLSRMYHCLTYTLFNFTRMTQWPLPKTIWHWHWNHNIWRLVCALLWDVTVGHEWLSKFTIFPVQKSFTLFILSIIFISLTTYFGWDQMTSDLVNITTELHNQIYQCNQHFCASEIP